MYYRDALFTRYPEPRVGGITNQYGAEFIESSELILSDGYLEKLDIPVTLISAEVDTFVVTEVNSYSCLKTIPDCREVLIPSTGHCLTQEEDEVLEQMWDKFDHLFDKLVTASC
ncbi:MAG: hypothetical protein GDA39_05830 [Hyphomonadaceae bacterium]|nr:hypothetical protein [Hyphomonadaceae bacterium]MBC6412425.1 hypothetical protein [Hyphomonadaceae bacterium]